MLQSENRFSQQNGSECGQLHDWYWDESGSS